MNDGLSNIKIDEIDYSIIISMYNPDWNKLVLTLDSIVEQKNIDFEIVICDDGSEQNFENEIQEYFENNSFEKYKLVMNPNNQGTVKNVISAFKVARGKYVKNISPGDYFYDDFVMSKFDDVIKKSDADIFFGNAVFFYDKVKENGMKERFLYPEKHNPIDFAPYIRNNGKQIRFNYLVRHDYILGASFVTKRELQLEYLLKIENYVKYAEDCSFVWMVAAGCKVKYIDIPFIWYEYGTGISTQRSDKWEKILYEDNRNAYKQMYAKRDIKKWVFDVAYSKNIFWKCILRLFVYCITKFYVGDK